MQDTRDRRPTARGTKATAPQSSRVGAGSQCPGHLAARALHPSVTGRARTRAHLVLVDAEDPHIAGPVQTVPVELGVLGTVEAWVGRRPVDLGGPMDRAVLAMLALALPRGVAEDGLVDGLWGEDPPATAAKALHNKVVRLRKAFRSAGAGDAVIETTGHGYRVCLAPANVDVHAVEALAARARAALVGGHRAVASALLASALRRWRGDALADLGHLPFAPPARSAYAELRWMLVEERHAVELACGHHHGLMAELRRAALEAPMRDRPWEHLLVALHRCGRQAEALQAFQAHRRHLADELGLVPGARLVAIERAIAAGDPRLQRWSTEGEESWVSEEARGPSGVWRTRHVAP